MRSIGITLSPRHLVTLSSIHHGAVMKVTRTWLCIAEPASPRMPGPMDQVEVVPPV